MDARDGFVMPGSGSGAGSFYIHHHSAAAIGPRAQRGSVAGAEPPAAQQGVGPGEGQPVKKKRGRPRKYGPEGAVALALSPVSPGVSPDAGAAGQAKRGRGRPPGTGRKQLLASLGEWFSGSAGGGFTPHAITISIGEDIAAKIMSFSQQGPRAICVLSANGAVSTVTLRQPATSGGTVTYEGHFEILSLSGSYMMTEEGGSRSRSGGLSVSLSNPDGRVIGGGVGGFLIAATQVQVIVGSFSYGGLKAKNKTKTDQEQGQESELLILDAQNTPSPSAIPCQSQTAPLIGGWQGSRQMEMKNAHIDIDLMRG